jgi:hypothetical protein
MKKHTIVLSSIMLLIPFTGKTKSDDFSRFYEPEDQSKITYAQFIRGFAIFTTHSNT